MVKKVKRGKGKYLLIRKTKKAKRCKICKKIIYEWNKSGLCSFHLKQKWEKEKYGKKNKTFRI